MTADSKKGSDLLQRSLYVFSLPSEVLDTLSLKSHSNLHESGDIEINSSVRTQSVEKANGGDPAGEAQNTEPAKATSCNLCNLKFTSVQEQREHVRSDQHKYNIKQRLKGLPTVSEHDFERLIGDLDESISGSESSDNDSDDDKTEDNPLAILLKRQGNHSQDATSSAAPKVGSPFLWFGSSALESKTSLGIYRALFSPADYDSAVDVLKKKQYATILSSKSHVAPAKPAVNSPSYFLCMVGGGHFAAMVVSLAPKLVVTHKGANERQAVVLAHKTFHRYTTRRKQGGSQSANDNAKGAAHSAGAGIRRANEAALQQEVRALLANWRTMIDQCELIFVRATGSENRRTLFGPYDGQVLRSNDSRNRGFPFTTRRATQSELIRAFQELTKVKVSDVDETVASASIKEFPVAPIVKSKPKAIKPSPEDEAIIHHSAQISALIKRSKVPALVTYVESNNLDLKSFIFKESPYFSPLHMAASMGTAPIVSALLLKCDANPVLRNEQSKSSYEIAKDRSTREAFRSARFELGESAWEWDAANVGAALDPAEAAARRLKDKEAEAEEAAQESARRKAETDRLRSESKKQEEAETERRIGKGRALGELTGADKRELEGRGLTPEMRARLERERRARAAEARMKR